MTMQILFFPQNAIVSYNHLSFLALFSFVFANDLSYLMVLFLVASSWLPVAAFWTSYSLGLQVSCHPKTPFSCAQV